MFLEGGSVVEGLFLLLDSLPSWIGKVNSVLLEVSKEKVGKKIWLWILAPWVEQLA